MVAENNAQMQEATKELYVINQDDLLRQQAQAREDYEYYERQKQRKMEKLKKENAELTAKIKQQSAELEKLKAELELLKHS